MTRLLGYVDLSEPHFVAAVLAIVFNPLFWNVVSAPRADRQVDRRTDWWLFPPRLSLVSVGASSCFPAKVGTWGGRPSPWGPVTSWL